MRTGLLAPATREERRPVVSLLIVALIVLVISLGGVITAKGALRAIYAGGLVLAPAQAACCIIRLRRGRQEDARRSGTEE